MKTLLILAALVFPQVKPDQARNKVTPDQTRKQATPDQVKPRSVQPDQLKPRSVQPDQVGARSKDRPILRNCIRRIVERRIRNR